MQTLTWIAAALAALTFLVHTFVGGRFVARPLLEDRTLPKAAKWLSYYCWHVTTALIAALACAFAAVALSPSAAVATPILFGLGGLSAALSVLSAWVAFKGRIHPLRFPSTTLFALVAISGAGAALMPG